MPTPRAIRLSLRMWLFLLSLVAMLPLLAFSLYAMSELHRTQHQLVLEDLSDRSKEIARATTQRVQIAVSALNALAESDAARKSDWEGLYAQAKRLTQREPLFRAVTLVAPSNQLLFHTSLPFGEVVPIAANSSEQVQAVFASGKPNASGPFVLPVSPSAVVAVSVPLYQGGQVAYVLRIHMLTSSLSELLRSFELPEGWVAGITDKQGTVLARSHSGDKIVGKQGSPIFLQALREGRTTPYETRTLEGVPATALLRPLQGLDWVVGISVANSILNAPNQAYQQRLALLAVLWLALSFVASSILATRMVRQMRALVGAANVGGTPEGPNAQVSVTEFEALWAGVQRSKTEIAQAAENLDDAIQERDEITDLYDNAPCGYHTVDKLGHILRINQTELDWLGYKEREMLGKRFYDFVDEGSQEAMRSEHFRYLERGYTRNLEVQLKRKDGSLMNVLISATMVKDADGLQLAKRVTVFDISERKALEARVEELERGVTSPAPLGDA